MLCVGLVPRALDLGSGSGCREAWALWALRAHLA